MLQDRLSLNCLLRMSSLHRFLLTLTLILWWSFGYIFLTNIFPIVLKYFLKYPITLFPIINYIILHFKYIYIYFFEEPIHVYNLFLSYWIHYLPSTPPSEAHQPVSLSTSSLLFIVIIILPESSLCWTYANGCGAIQWVMGSQSTSSHIPRKKKWPLLQQPSASNSSSARGDAVGTRQSMLDFWWPWFGAVIVQAVSDGCLFRRCASELSCTFWLSHSFRPLF